MALSCFVRRASSSIIPLSIRSIGSRIPCQTETSLLNVENRFAVRCGQILPIVRFSTVTNNNIESHNIDDSSKPSFNDGLDGLPFDIKAGGLDDGYLTLIKKSPDEIIEVKVRPYYEQVPTSYDQERRSYYRNKELVQAMKILGDHTEKDRDVHHLYMVVKIYHGDQFSKCQNFFIFVYPDFVQIRMMTLSGAESGTKVHLEEFEEFFQKRGITPSNTNCLFDYFKNRLL